MPFRVCHARPSRNLPCAHFTALWLAPLCHNCLTSTCPTLPDSNSPSHSAPIHACITMICPTEPHPAVLYQSTLAKLCLTAPSPVSPDSASPGQSCYAAPCLTGTHSARLERANQSSSDHPRLPFPARPQRYNRRPVAPNRADLAVSVLVPPDHASSRLVR